MGAWPSPMAQEIIKEKSSGRPDKVFGGRNLGFPGLGDLKARATRDRI